MVHILTTVFDGFSRLTEETRARARAHTHTHTQTHTHTHISVKLSDVCSDHSISNSVPTAGHSAPSATAYISEDTTAGYARPSYRPSSVVIGSSQAFRGPIANSHKTLSFRNWTRYKTSDLNDRNIYLFHDTGCS